MTRLIWKAASAGIVALLLGGSAASAGGSLGVQLAQQQDPGQDGDDQADGSAMVVRVGRLESQIRTLTGQIEQLQFQNRKLEDDLRKMQGDVDFRFQDLQRQGGAPAPRPIVPQKRTDADGGGLPPPADATPAPGTATPGTPDVPRTKVARGDAFDPASDPNAPGAPKPLGSTTPSQPLARASRPTDAPLDLMQRPATAGTGEPDPGVIMAPSAAPRDPNALASLIPGGTREEYDADLGLYKQGQYDGAATGFQAFATKYPRDRLVPDAVYLAGESYARLGRHREAAEQFLKVSTDYGKSPRAPDALLRLGMSLGALGAKEQACATYLEVNRRYPAASADVHTAVDRELKRARCPENG